MDFISNGKPVDHFNQDTTLNPSANGEEHRLFCVILDLVEKAMGAGHTPPCFGDSDRLKHFFDGGLFLAREEQNEDSFPDFLFINDSRVFCVEHTRINASRKLERGGDEYSKFLGDNNELFDEPFPERLDQALKNEGIIFSKQQLRRNFLTALERKISKISKYKDVAREHIKNGSNRTAVEEDLNKPIEAWLLIEDISPATSFKSLFSCGEAIERLKAHPELNGVIFVHHGRITKAPENLDEVAFIFNEELAWSQLEAISKNNDEYRLSCPQIQGGAGGEQ